jgi:hypothetical protein
MTILESSPFDVAVTDRLLGTTRSVCRRLDPTLHVSREKEGAELLDIPDDVTQVGLVPVAYTLGTEFKAANRQPVDEVTCWNTWDNVSGPSA